MNTIFITTEDNKLFITEDGVFLTIDPLVLAEARERFVALPITDEFKLID